MDEANEWKDEPLKGFLKGINSLEDPELIDPGELIEAKNVFYKKELIQTDTGYIKFRGLVRGTPQQSYQFFKKNGTDELLLVTTDTVYRDVNSQWQYLKGTAGTTLTAQANAGATALTVAAIAGFADNDFIGVILDDGSQHQTRVNGAPAGVTINIDDAIPVGRNAPNGAAVVLAVILTGSLDEQVQFVPVPSHDWLTFTNGVDRPKRYDGTDCINIPGLPSAGDIVAKAMALFNGSLWLLNVIQAGTAFPQRAWRSKIGDPTIWTTAAGDTSGFNDLFETEDFILAGVPLGPYLIIYRERAIVRCEYVGSADKMYNFTSTVTGEGAVSGSAVVDMGDHHIFFGNANLYEYRGGFDIIPVGDKMYYRIYGVDGDMNILKRHTIWGLYVEELDEIWFMVPRSADALPKKLIRFDRGNDRFTERVFNNSFVGYGYFRRSVSLIWTALVGSWLDQDWKWNSVSILAGAPTTLLCPGDGAAQVQEYEYLAQTDDGTVIPFQVETKDFTDPDYLTRFNSIGFKLFGSNVVVEYSTDGGNSWNNLGTISSGSVAEFFRLYQQFVAKKFRFRWSGTGKFSLGWLSIETLLESEY